MTRSRTRTIRALPRSSWFPTRPRSPKTDRTRKPMTDYGDSKVIDVLLVEDDEGDVLMTREAFEYYKIRNRLHVVSDGDQALQFLRKTGPSADAPPPGLLLPSF